MLNVKGTWLTPFFSGIFKLFLAAVTEGGREVEVLFWLWKGFMIQFLFSVAKVETVFPYVWLVWG